MTDVHKAGRRILLVEDSLLVAMEVEAALMDAGFEVTVAANRADGMAALEAGNFACAILDFDLGDGDCTPIALSLHQADCPVAIVTGHATEAISPHLLVFAQFHKPILANALADWARSVTDTQP